MENKYVTVNEMPMITDETTELVKEVVNELAKKIDDYIFMALKNEFKYIIRKQPYMKLDNDAYVYKQELILTNTMPHNLAFIDLTILIEKFNELQIDYMNMSKEELKEECIRLLKI